MSLAIKTPVHEIEQWPSSVITEYMAYERIDPFGESRADLRAGIVASTVANHSMSPPKSPSRPSDFMPFTKSREPIKLKNKVEHGKFIANSLFAGLTIKKAGMR